MNFQESTTILNASTKKVWKLIECTTYIYIYIYIYIYWFEGIFFFRIENKIPRTTVDYTIRRHQEMQWNKTKSKTGRPKATTKPEDNFIRVTSLHDRRLIVWNITGQLNQCGEKNVSKSTVSRRLWTQPIWQNCYQETNAEEAKQCQKAPVGQGAQRLNNWWMELSPQDLVKLENLYAVKSQWKSCNHLYHTNHNIVWRRLCYVVGGFCQLQSQGFAPGEGQTKSDWLSQNIRAIGLMSRVFANGPGDQSSIPGWVLQKTQRWYLVWPCLTLRIIRYGSRVKWSNPGNGVVPSPTPWCSSYRKGSLWGTLD